MTYKNVILYMNCLPIIIINNDFNESKIVNCTKYSIVGLVA